MCKQRPKVQEPEVIKVHLGHPQRWSWSWRCPLEVVCRPLEVVCRPLEVVCRPLDVRHHCRPAVEDCHLPVGGGGDLLVHEDDDVVADDGGGDHLLIGGGGDPLVHERGDALSRV